MINFKKIISRQPRLLDLPRVFGGYSIQPAFLLVNLTYDCNCGCRDCYQKFDNFYSAKNGMISAAQFEKILLDAKASFRFKPVIHFFGGEPLVNPEFAQMLKLADKYGFKSSLTTNGVLLDKYLENIKRSNLGQINISLDNIGERHDKERGYTGCFNKVLDSIKKIGEWENKIRSGKLININCVLSKNNLQYLLDLAVYFRDNNIKIDSLTFQHKYQNPSDFESKISVSGLKQAMAKIRQEKICYPIYFSPNIGPDDLESFYSDRKNFIISCNLPWLGLNILPNLEVTPGGGVLGCNTVVGDFDKESLGKIWNNQKMKEFRKKILKCGAPKNCFGCCHARYKQIT